MGRAACNLLENRVETALGTEAKRRRYVACRHVGRQQQFLCHQYPPQLYVFAHALPRLVLHHVVEIFGRHFQFGRYPACRQHALRGGLARAQKAVYYAVNGLYCSRVGLVTGDKLACVEPLTIVEQQFDAVAYYCLAVFVYAPFQLAVDAVETSAYHLQFAARQMERLVRVVFKEREVLYPHAQRRASYYVGMKYQYSSAALSEVYLACRRGKRHGGFGEVVVVLSAFSGSASVAHHLHRIAVGGHVAAAALARHVYQAYLRMPCLLVEGAVALAHIVCRVADMAHCVSCHLVFSALAVIVLH